MPSDNRTALAAALTPGIDISHFQGSVDWPAVAASGVKFAMIKATQGSSFIDPRLPANYAGARYAGLAVGLYHVFVKGAGSANATHFAEVAKDHPSQLPAWLDLEPGSVADDETEQEALGMIECIATELGRAALYSNPSTIQSHLKDPGWLKFPLAIGHYDVSTPTITPWPQFLFWQHSQTGKVPGIAGNCDLDWFNGSSAEFQILIDSAS